MGLHANAGTVKLPLVGEKAESLFMWRDVKKSGIAFAVATAAYFLLEKGHISLLAVLANAGLLLVSVAFLWNNIATFSNRPGMPLPGFVISGLRESDVKSYAEVVAGYLNKGLAFAKRVLTGKEVILTGQVAVSLYALSKMSGYFTTLGLLYTIVLLFFTLPKAYELNKPQVDNFLAHGHHQVKSNYNQYVQPYVNKIPRASTSTTSGKPLVPTDLGDTAISKQVEDLSLPNGGKKVF